MHDPHTLKWGTSDAGNVEAILDSRIEIEWTIEDTLNPV